MMRLIRHIQQRTFSFSFSSSYYLPISKTKVFRSSSSSNNFSTVLTEKQQSLDPSKYVIGVTHERLEKEPNLLSYFESNFPEWDPKNDEDDDDDEVEVEETKEESEDNLFVLDGETSFEDIDFESLDNETIEHIYMETFESKEAKAKAAVWSRKPKRPMDPIDDALAARNIRPLHTYLRNSETNKKEEGSRSCQKMRGDHDFHPNSRHRFIPGIIYGANPTLGITGSRDESILIKTPWNTLQRELDLYRSHFSSHVYELSLLLRNDNNEDDDDDGAAPTAAAEVLSKQLVIPTDVQCHPVLNKYYCINFLRYHPGRVIPIPIQYINTEESPALKRGGYFPPIHKFVPCLVEDGAPIPNVLELDCSGLQMQQVVRLNRVTFPHGVIPNKGVDVNEFLIGTVIGRRSDEEDDEDDEDDD